MRIAFKSNLRSFSRFIFTLTSNIFAKNAGGSAIARDEDGIFSYFWTSNVTIDMRNRFGMWPQANGLGKVLRNDNIIHCLCSSVSHCDMETNVRTKIGSTITAVFKSASDNPGKEHEKCNYG